MAVFERSLAGLVVESYEGDIVRDVFHGKGSAKFVGGHSYEVCIDALCT